MKKLLVLSDMQVGHKLAVMSDTATVRQLPGEEPTPVTQNKVQKALFSAWKETAKTFQKPDILVLNGEPIEGQQSKNRGIEVWSTNIYDQIDESIKLVQMFNPKEIYVIRGSGYHITLDGIPLEELFGKQIGATKIDGNYSNYELFLNVEGVDMHFSHHIGASSVWQYRATPIARELALMLLNESHKYPATIIVRSHVHYYCYVGFSRQFGMTTPCWQLQTEYMYRKGVAGLVPDIGAVQFTLDNGKYDWEAKLFKLQEFKPPKRVVK